ncbi:hypothetical protein SAMN05216251_13614 [Actinacidiphila alni]|uniref:Uncharacterized protein n=1 Tax=Actinacidiphila alni TaxID=380248 RepID=A0A1I2MP04_9ACTN|nr:hypothetical protein SAMN05216251_13614 [Actinacidiphila alni]
MGGAVVARQYGVRLQPQNGKYPERRHVTRRHSTTDG